MRRKWTFPISSFCTDTQRRASKQTRHTCMPYILTLCNVFFPPQNFHNFPDARQSSLISPKRSIIFTTNVSLPSLPIPLCFIRTFANLYWPVRIARFYVEWKLKSKNYLSESPLRIFQHTIATVLRHEYSPAFSWAIARSFCVPLICVHTACFLVSSRCLGILCPKLYQCTRLTDSFLHSDFGWRSW